MPIPTPINMKSAPNVVELNSLHTRRQFFSRTATGIGSVALASLLAESTTAGNEDPTTANQGILTKPHFSPKAKRVIYLFMQGGPSQLDLFDPKPGLAKLHGQDL